MGLKRLGVRAAALLPSALLVACSEQDVGEAIEDAIIDILAGIGKVLLIGMGLMIAWAAMVVSAVALIVLGVRRKKFDAGSVALLVPGVALLVGAWPVVFSEDGLGGVLAPGSLPDTTAGPYLLQGIVVGTIVGLIVFLVQRRRTRRAAAAPAVAPESVAAPLPPPPLPGPAAPAPGASNGAALEIEASPAGKVAVATKPRAPARKPVSRTRAFTATRRSSKSPAPRRKSSR